MSNIKKEKKLKCQCPDASSVPSERERMYRPEEKSGMNHEPNKCRGTNDIKLYERDGKKLYLCSCCCVFGDKELKEKEVIKMDSKKILDDMEQFTEWVDADVIADLVFTSIDDIGIEPTLAGAKQVWRALLEYLGKQLADPTFLQEECGL